MTMTISKTISIMMFLVTCFVYFDHVNGDEPSPCPEHYTLLVDHCYRYFSDAKRWREAYKVCKHEEAVLSPVKSHQENIDIFEHFRELAGDQLDDGYWIGLSDFTDNGNFRWATASDYSNGAGNYRKWQKGQPKEYSSWGYQGKECVKVQEERDENIEYHEEMAPMWKTVNCEGSSRLPFFCRKNSA